MASERGDVLLIQFAREPCPGQVKTRMTPFLSAQAACDLHCELVLWTSERLVSADLGDVELSVAGDLSSPLFDACLRGGVQRLTRQKGDDLGQRMYRALHCGLARYRHVVLVGSDCPEIDGAYLNKALAALDKTSLVIGPATDGGYVLLAVRQVHPAMFRGIAWGGSRVYTDTLAALEREGLEWQTLPVLSDVDRPEDLPLWQAVKAGVV